MAKTDKITIEIDSKKATAELAEYRKSALIGIGELLDEMAAAFSIKDRGQRTAAVQAAKLKLNELREGVK